MRWEESVACGVVGLRLRTLREWATRCEVVVAAGRNNFVDADTSRTMFLSSMRSLRPTVTRSPYRRVVRHRHPRCLASTKSSKRPDFLRYDPRRDSEPSRTQ